VRGPAGWFPSANAHIMVMLDSEGSTDSRETPSVVGALLGGADIAVSSRCVRGGGIADMQTHRKPGNWALTRWVRVGFNERYSDLCYGYRAFWMGVLPHIDDEYTGFEVETLIHIRALQASLKVAEVPSFESGRIHGVSRLRPALDGARVLRSFTPPFSREARERRRAAR
jgi:hypothetical protein